MITILAIAAPLYLWPAAPSRAGSLEERFAPPAGALRVELPADSFGAWLRRLPLLPDGTPVRLFDGNLKPRQDVHAAVVDLDVGRRDLQQCADAVMRLRAEYLRARGLPIVFHPDPGKPRELRWSGGADFQKYLLRLFAEAGTASLAAELQPVRGRAPAPGDVLIQGGYPGHAVLILDAAEAPDGRRWVLLGQSYMPAQQFHVLKNPSGGVWYDLAMLDDPGLRTPEWRPFFRRDARHF
jgi:Domain of unknown function (4846)